MTPMNSRKGMDGSILAIWEQEGMKKNREWQENKRKPIPRFLEKLFPKFTKKNCRFHSQQGPETEMEGKFGR